MKAVASTTSSVLKDLRIVCDGYCRYPYGDPAILEDRCSHCRVYHLLQQYEAKASALKKQLDTAESCIIAVEDHLARGQKNYWASKEIEDYEHKKEGSKKMMQVYLNAMNMSRTGAPTYVLEKGLDIVLLRQGPSLLSHLRDGYELKAKYVNGSAEYSWRLTNKVHHLAISRVLFGNPSKIKTGMLIVSVQEFCDHANVDDITYRLNVFGWEKDRASHIWEAPLDRVANQEAFREGQKKASVLLDLLTIHLHERRDSHTLRLLLEHEERNGWPENLED